MDAGPPIETRLFSTRLSVGRTASILLVMLLLVFAGILWTWLFQSYDSTRRQLEERVIASAKIVSTNAEWISTLAHQALRRIDEALPDAVAISASDQVRSIDDAVQGLPGQVKAYVVDAAGNTVYSTDPEIKPLRITDRDYFSVLANGAQDYVSSLLISRLNGSQIFVFSHRLVRDGRFAGAAIVSFDVSLLKAIWESVDLGPNSTVSLIRQDGMLVARYPLAERPLDMSGYVLFTEHLPKSPTGTYLAISPVDGARRIVAYRKIEGTQLIAVSAADYRVGMQPFWRIVFAAAILSLPTLAGTAIAAWWIRTLLQRDKCQTRTLIASNAEKALLLQEIHHRVKNNLQSVQSLIRMHKLPDDLQAALGSRINAMVAVHQHIYKRDQFMVLELRQLVRSVVDDVVKAYQCAADVRYDIDDVAVSNDFATPWALLVNEVVTNAIKYAVTGQSPLVLAITIKAMDNRRAQLSISDNGPGFDDAAANAGMGHRLIKAVVGQLEGTFRYEFSDGTTFIAELGLGNTAPEPQPSA
jgi:two-component sensor histidine kinase